MSLRLPVALTIAGSDGSGGAGIQADLKTFSALGCYGMTVLTALPIQNTQGVKAIYRISSECVKEQLETVMEDIPIDAIKIGMLHLPEIIEIVADKLRLYPLNIVLDPVMVAKNGSSLMTADAISLLKQRLFPLAALVTPNLFEASALLGKELVTKRDMEKTALEIMDLGPKAVVIKGGHLVGHPCEDCLCMGSERTIRWFSASRILTKNTHGTGCTFSSAITAFLAKGISIEESVARAKKYISHCIKAAQDLQIGQGYGPVHHFHALWKNRRTGR